MAVTEDEVLDGFDSLESDIVQGMQLVKRIEERTGKHESEVVDAVNNAIQGGKLSRNDRTNSISKN